MHCCSFFHLFIYLLGKQIDKLYEEVTLFYIEIVTFFQTILLEPDFSISLTVFRRQHFLFPFLR